MTQRSGPRGAPIFAAFVRPPTVFGCDPRLFSLVSTLAAILVGPAGIARLNFAMVVLGVAVFAASVVWLNALSKSDPHAVSVFLRSLRYSRRYDARARWDVRVRSRRAWS